MLGAFVLAACGRAGAPAGAGQGQGRGGPGGAPPATAVQVVTLQQKPVQDASEFIATVRSLHSTTIQPQVEGRITKIFVTSGEVVRPGAPLVQIDPERQAATVRNSESQRVGREADVAYWKGQVERLRSLLSAGAISQNEFDTAQHNLETAQAALQSLSAQVREGEVQLHYYRVTAPTDGIVGDIPVREGDRVTTSTVITTIDDKQGLEAQIQVPVDRGPDLRVGLPIEIIDADGKVIVSDAITFVAPRVDLATQTVLAKSLLRNAPPSVKVQQFLRVRVIWRSTPGLTIPLISVTRINGQFFCFVAEASGQGYVARQRAVQVGSLEGNDYVVTGGLKPGDRLIVSGIQKIADGAPVRIQ